MPQTRLDIRRIGAMHIVTNMGSLTPEQIGRLTDTLIRHSLVKSGELRALKSDELTSHTGNGPIVTTTINYHLVLSSTNGGDISDVIIAHVDEMFAA